jgi:outer membrane lipoprotein-sorting protein
MKKFKLIIVALLILLLLSAAVQASAPTYLFLPLVQGGPVPCADEFATRAECAK